MLGCLPGTSSSPVLCAGVQRAAGRQVIAAVERRATKRVGNRGIGISPVPRFPSKMHVYT